MITYSKTRLKRPLKNRQNKGLKDKWKLNEGCKYFDLHYAIVCLENQFLVFFEWPLKTGFIV